MKRARNDDRDGSSSAVMAYLRWMRCYLVHTMKLPKGHPTGDVVLDLSVMAPRETKEDVTTWASASASRYIAVGGSQELITSLSATSQLHDAVHRKRKRPDFAFAILYSPSMSIANLRALQSPAVTLPGLGEYSVCVGNFALDCACGSADGLRSLLEMVYAALRPGGCFVGTCVDADVAIRKLRNLTSATSIDSGPVKITLLGKDGAVASPDALKRFPRSEPPVGNALRLELPDRVLDLYVVVPAYVTQVAEEVGFQIQWNGWLNLHDIIAERVDGNPQMKRMLASLCLKPPDVDEWDALYLFAAFAFIKPQSSAAE